MILISHRGNINGAKSELENSPKQIEFCISKKFQVEIDLRLVDNKWFLGHDHPEYEIDFKFLLKHHNKLWIHCKNYEALEKLREYDLNYFWHDTDDFTLTSKKDIWALPGSFVGMMSIVVMPEKYYSFEEIKKLNCRGICSDYIETFL